MSSLTCLTWWPNWRLRVHANLLTGAARSRWRPCRHQVQGQAWRTGGAWYLLHAVDGEMALQVGRKVLLFSRIREMSILPAGTRRRILRIEGEGQRLEVSYASPADRFWNRLDPTFDGFDEELNDFFVRVLRVWQSKSKGKELLEAWTK